MSAERRFNAGLPTPHEADWRDAYRKRRNPRGEGPLYDPGDEPRSASYAPPGGEGVPFILDGFRFTGGSSTDTAEYPFGGLWSNEWLNEKPQELSVDGFLRGADYITGRNALIEALRVPTDDDNPGYIDLPFWGRFPVVVGESYEVSERSDEQGQCRVSIPFKRAGTSVAERSQGEPSQSVEDATANLANAAADDFEAELDSGRLDWKALRAGFGRIKAGLLSAIGRIQGVQTVLNSMTADVLGILGLIDLGVKSPRALAMTVFNSVASIVSGVVEIKNSVAAYGREGGSPVSPGDENTAAGGRGVPAADNERNALLMFLSPDESASTEAAATVAQEATTRAVKNLYRTAAFVAAANIMAGLDSPTREAAAGYWRLLEKLADGIDGENPAVHSAVRDVLSALSARLSNVQLRAEKTRSFQTDLPLLCLAHDLGCDESELRRLNGVADSFAVAGEVVYV